MCEIEAYSVPRQSTTRLVLDHAGFKEVSLLLEVNHLTHPGEGILFIGEQSIQTDLRCTPVGDVAQIAFEHGGVHAENASGHGVFCVAVFKFYSFGKELGNFCLELARPQMGVFKFDLIDQINAEIAVHGLVAQDVLVLLGSTRHLVLTTQSQNLCEADIKEEAFHEAGENNQRLQQHLIVLGRAGVEVGIHDRLNVGDQELIFVANGADFVVGIEDFTLIKTQGLHNVLVGVGVNGFFKRLAQQKLSALGRCDVAIGAEHNVVGRQGVGGHKEAEVPLHNAAFVLCQSIGIFPKRDVTRHVDLLRHPVVRTGRQILLPCPFVFERHELIDVGLPIDDSLVGGIDAFARHHRLACLSGRAARGDGRT